METMLVLIMEKEKDCRNLWKKKSKFKCKKNKYNRTSKLI